MDISVKRDPGNLVQYLNFFALSIFFDNNHCATSASRKVKM